MTMPPLDYLPFSPPNISERAIEAVSTTLRSGWLGTGPLTAEFEQRFAALKGVGHAAAVSSCTSGLFLALKALQIGSGDEVITTNMTFVSTVNSIIHAGATPVLADTDSLTGNISVDHLESLISSKTRAIIPVHYAGFPADMVSIMKIAREFNLRVIEDCAHAIETMVAGQPAGSFGDFGVFSFYATKNIAVGEGGMVISDNADLIRRVASLSLHGLTRGAWQRFSSGAKRTYDVAEVGYKANFTDVQAAIALAQLEELEENSLRRKEIWSHYTRELVGYDLSLPELSAEPGNIHALHLYVVLLPEKLERDDFVELLGERHKIAFGVHYRAVSQFELYRERLDLDSASFPASENWGGRCLSLSISAAMTDEHVERVVRALRTELI